MRITSTEPENSVQAKYKS